MRLIKNIIKKTPFFKKQLSNYKNTWNPSIQSVIDELFHKKKGIRILDIGANKGQSIDLFQSIFDSPQIISFEPTPDLYLMLKSKYDDDNIQIVDLALGDKCGEHEFYISDFSATNSLLRPNPDKYSKFNDGLVKILEHSKTIKVDVLTLDHWINNNMPNTEIDIIKIDTQGFDYSVLNGGQSVIRDKTKIVITELHFSEYYQGYSKPSKIFQLMEDLDFELLNLVEFNRNGTELAECNAIFINNSFNID